MSGANRSYSGSYVGTGAIIEVDKVGFQPSRVELFNADDPTFVVKHEGMPGHEFAKQEGANTTYETVNDGITLHANGFDIGAADADLNTAGETVHFTAFEGNY